jgi:hypothetical protein
VTIACVALPSAVLAAYLFMVALRLGASVNGRRILCGDVGAGYADLVLRYTLLGTRPVSRVSFFAFGSALSLREFDSRRRDLLLSICAGLAAGCGVRHLPAGCGCDAVWSPKHLS